jgi:hypothetical protein
VSSPTTGQTGTPLGAKRVWEELVAEVVAVDERLWVVEVPEMEVGLGLEVDPPVGWEVVEVDTIEVVGVTVNWVWEPLIVDVGITVEDRAVIR